VGDNCGGIIPAAWGTDNTCPLSGRRACPRCGIRQGSRQAALPFFRIRHFHPLTFAWTCSLPQLRLLGDGGFAGFGIDEAAVDDRVFASVGNAADQNRLGAGQTAQLLSGGAVNET